MTRDGVLAEIALRSYSGMPLYSVITVESVRNLGLEPGCRSWPRSRRRWWRSSRPTGPGAVRRNNVGAVAPGARHRRGVAEITRRGRRRRTAVRVISAGALEDAPLAPGDLVQFRFKAMAVVLGAL